MLGKKGVAHVHQVGQVRGIPTVNGLCEPWPRPKEVKSNYAGQFSCPKAFCVEMKKFLRIVLRFELRGKYML